MTCGMDGIYESNLFFSFVYVVVQMFTAEFSKMAVAHLTATQNKSTTCNCQPYFKSYCSRVGGLSSRVQAPVMPSFCEALVYSSD